MAENGDIELFITLDDGAVVKGLVRAENQAKRSGESVEGSMRKGFSGGFKFLSGQVVALGAAFAAAFAGRKIIEAASGYQAAVSRLNQSLIAAGTFSTEASKSMIALADSIQETTTTGDDAALSALALARNFTKTNEQAQALTKAALDLSAATGDSLDSSVEKLGGTFSGTAGKLTKLVPGLKTLTEEQLKAGAAVDIVAARFKGFAEGEINTFAGSIKQAGNRFDDLLKTIGNIVVQSPAVTAAMGTLSGVLLKITDGIKEIKGDPLKAFILVALDFADAINVGIIAPLELVIKIVRVTFNVLQQLAQGVVVALSTTAASALQVVGLFTDKFKKSEDTLRTFSDDAIKMFGDIQKKGANITSGIFDFDATAKTTEVIDAVRTAVENAAPLPPLKVTPPDFKSTKEAVESISFDSISKAFDSTANKIKITSESIAATLRDGFLTGITSSFAAFGGALAKGENAFAAFGKSILKSLGGILIQFGTMMIAIGASLSTVPFIFGLSGPAAIGAGIAAVVLGGALQALGGGGGGATAPSTSGGGVGASAGGTASGGEITAGVAEIPEAKPTVNVTVQGNILDRRQTGLEIADVLREAFDGNAVVFV